MKALWRLFRLILREQRSAFVRGGVLAFVVLVMGAALLGLSGWFITAAAAAGMAGLGAVFDVFRPSAMVRFLALGRAAARYGERLLTHDATLRALEVLRLRVLEGFLAVPYARMVQMRGPQALNRLTADIDALDGVPLRVILPFLAGLAAQLAAFVALWALTGLAMALWIVGGYVVGVAMIFLRTAHAAVPLSRRAESAAQAFRARLIDMIRARRDLAVYGRLTSQADHVQAAEFRRRDLRREQDRIDRFAGLAVQLLATLIAGGALWLGVHLAQLGTMTPAFAALGFFTALALAETIAPLRRAAADLGRMGVAARRVLIAPAPDPDLSPLHAPGDGPLQVTALTLTRPRTSGALIEDFSLTVSPGETVALTGASGCGKSTLLLAIAGLHPIASGSIALGGVRIEECADEPLRQAVTMLPQRSALMAGTVRDALRLAAPDGDDEAFWRALDAVHLSGTLHARDGLETVIGARGEGLSGGEGRRLTLARALLRQPRFLLLDEPTEGLDDVMAAQVLQGIRAYLPGAAVLIAAHRSAEILFADRRVALNNLYLQY